ncbi:DNA primase [Streptomyces sp. NPDC006422]|uniref:DNA primase n=1 Tax=unclassified Streptomyces TaxID=2593676 RepID=UPI0033ACF8FD
MNRTAIGLAVGAGYVLGRTKKMKLAFAVGTMVAGKRLNLSPRGIAELVSTQLEKNPQFKEIGDQLREDLRGVGKAASGALVERQIEGLAGRLHDRTQGVRDQIQGVAPDADDVRDAGERVTGVATGRGRDRGQDEERYDDEAADEPDEEPEEERRPAPSRTATKKAAKKAPAKKKAPAPANKRAAGPQAAKKTAAKKKAAAKGGRGRG